MSDEKKLAKLLRNVLTPGSDWDHASDFSKSKYEEAAHELAIEVMRQERIIQGKLDFEHGPYVYHDDQSTGQHIGRLAGRRVMIVVLD